MEKIELKNGPRPDYQQIAEDAGFNFHTMYGETYWDESSYYSFTLEEVEKDIEDPSTELHMMCKEAVADIVLNEELMEKMGIPGIRMDYVANSWKNEKDKNLYGRFDLVYYGMNSAKMLEYNADTPTSLFEASNFQWFWLEDMIKRGHLPDEADQFNSIFEALTERFAQIFNGDENVHFTCFEDAPEDYATVETLAWAAREAGLATKFVNISDIGVSALGKFVDNEDNEIKNMFKLYPWEHMFQDEFSAYLTKSECNFIEPAWKSLVSNKGILPILWEMFEGHPNLLPSFFIEDANSNNPVFARVADRMETGHVIKPIFSREGSSITIKSYDHEVDKSENMDYITNQLIVQEYSPLPIFNGFRPIIGSWIVGDMCVGMGIREDMSQITQDLSKFKPHIIMG